MVEGTVFRFRECKEDLLTELEHCKLHFVTALRDMYIEEDTHCKSTERYAAFGDKYGEAIKWDLSLEVFNQLVPSEALKELCSCKLLPATPYPATKRGKDIEKTFMNSYGTFSEDFEDLFGAGEFPVMRFRVIKLADKYYSFYTISR